MQLREEWNGFTGGHWVDDINVRDFIQRNYTEYTGDDSFLAGPTDATDTLWGKVQELQAEERAHNGVLECETEVVSGLTTPEASELHALLAAMNEADVESAAVEVSAQALSRHRVDGVVFDVAGFTNLSHDHLDDYGTLEAYFAAKLPLKR